MLANGPPLAFDGSAGLEGSLVDPPISPGPFQEKWSEASGAESSMTSPEFPSLPFNG